MKRLLFWMLASVLVLPLTCNVFAAGTGVTVSNAEGGPGQTVYLTVELQEAVEASAIGIQCHYDASLLVAMPELSTWEKDGLLSAFEAENKGVWASEKVVPLEGKLCVLAFQILEDVAFDSTEVRCTVVIKDGVQEKLNTTVIGVVGCQCTHEYGPWESADKVYHTRICQLCGGKNTQSHHWNSGVQETQPTGQVLLVKTCTVCNARQAEEVNTTEQGSANLPGAAPEDPHNHDHTSQVTDETEHDHSHDGDIADEHIHTEAENDPVTVWIVLLVPLALIAAGILFLKKR